MSKLCRLKSNNHGADGQWAYDEIMRLTSEHTAQLAELELIDEALGTREGHSAVYHIEALRDKVERYSEAFCIMKEAWYSDKRPNGWYKNETITWAVKIDQTLKEEL